MERIEVVEGKLKKYEQTLSSAKEEMSEKKGSLKNDLDRLKKEFSCKSLSEGQKLLVSYNKEEKELEEQISNLIADLEANYVL